MMNEAIIVQKLKAGDKSAFSELLSVHQKKVINTCYKFLLNKQDAEDIAQDVFIEVFQSIKSFHAKSKLSTWIYRIAVTKSLDEIKKKKRKKRITSIGKTLHIDDIANWIAGGSKTDKLLLEKEKMSEVFAALNKLPDNQRAAFTLSKIEGYTNPEIAEILKTTVDAVESLIYRAKKKVSNELKTILTFQET